MTQSYRECVDQATQALTDAWQHPEQAVQNLLKAELFLKEAKNYAEISNDPSKIQQVQDAYNAVEQAARSARNKNQDLTQTNNAIDQAARACKQIH